MITVASSHNFDFCKSVGATEVFDYKKDSVMDDVVNAVKKTGGEFAGLYDAISVQDQSFKYSIPIVEKLGGGILPTVLPPPQENVPSSVRPVGIFGVNPLTHSICKSTSSASNLIGS